jgi:hypothetical protein
VVDRSVELGLPVTEVPFGSKALDPARYNNKRTEMWCQVRDWLKAGGAIPLDDHLRSDLIGPTYRLTSGSALMLESKEDMNKRGLPSPDDGDALALTFAFPVSGEAKQFKDKLDHARRAYNPLKVVGWKRGRG